MFIELIDRLRCPAAHRESWLVARMDRVENRDVVDGSLGCPVCHAEYVIRDGVVCFVDEAPRLSTAPDAEAAMQLAAGLALVDTHSLALLDGAWGAHAHILRSLSPSQVLLVNPPLGVETGGGVSIIRARTATVAAGWRDAGAIDQSSSPEMRASLLRAVRDSGRVIGNGRFAPSAMLSLVLATDDLWVAEMHRQGPTVPLRRVPRGTP
jgi:uncharacterized protein YbaR (Trm112 family)